jgi:AraC-like DNA-binding protein
MQNQSSLTLVNTQNGTLAFEILSFEDGGFCDHIQRNSYYSLIWVTEGNGKLITGFSEYDFSGSNLFAFSPYQSFWFAANRIQGTAIHFHPDFFCIYKHQTEVACNGVLFNNVYQPPFTPIGESARDMLGMLIDRMKSEAREVSLAQYEILISWLKIFLITCSRLKAEQQPEMPEMASNSGGPFVLQHLKEAIEKDFRKKHSASEYARSLGISTNALARITKNYFNKTISELISERIIIEAKRELYLTNKAVKEIAYELGYEDEHYFSRFFKNNTDVSPQVFRETVGFGRGDV